LDEDCCAVAEDFGDAGHHFGGVVTDADDAVGAEGGGVLGHLVIGVEAGAFAQVGVDRDVAAEDGLKLRAKLADDRAIPRTSPRVPAILYPGRSKAVVMKRWSIT
jgi:hypothetical protein